MSWGLKKCCARSYEMFLDKRLFAKERNDGDIMDRTGPAIQVSAAGGGWVFVVRSRETQRAGKRRWQEECQAQQKQLDQKTRQIEEQAEEIAWLKRQVREFQRECAEAATKPVVLPDDPPAASHGYGARLISLAVNLAQGVGLRGSQRALEFFLTGWGSNRKFPTSRRSATGCCGWESRPARNPSRRRTIGFGWLIIPIKSALKKCCAFWAFAPRRCPRRERL